MTNLTDNPIAAGPVYAKPNWLWLNEDVEISGLLVGLNKDKTWNCDIIYLSHGARTQVEFDWREAVDREDHHGDVVGFYHTHPFGPSKPSTRDIRTMRAWCDCLGKSLLCVIGVPKRDAMDHFGYLFVNYRSRGRKMKLIDQTDAGFTFKE